MTGFRVGDGIFDTWEAGYDNASVEVIVAGTVGTLASLFTDEALSVAAVNPQTLITTTVNGINYGKFATPLYTGQAHYLQINSVDQTGVFRPALATLDAEDASASEVTAAGGGVANELEDIVARNVEATDYGLIDDSSTSANTTTIAAAIGAASARGGGTVWLPEGTIPFTQLSVPGNVLLRGRGRDVTMLQSQTGARVITLTGDAAGLADLTLDGVDQVISGVGIFSKSKNETRLHDVGIKHFETGVEQRGARRTTWCEVYIDNCITGALLRGDLDTGGGSDGDEYAGNYWYGGRVEECTGVGIELRFVDKKLHGNCFEDIGFENNTGIGIKIGGARFTRFSGCWFGGNTTNIAVADGTDTTKADENTVIALVFDHGYMDGGNSTFTGKLQDVIFDSYEFFATTNNCTFTIDIATNNILARDCTEDLNVVLAGNDALRWLRQESILGQDPGSFVVTTDATVTPAFRQTMDYGTIINVEAVVTAIARNGIDKAMYHVAQAAYRAGSTLAYQTQTANFTLGDMITGGTSGAKARVTADSDSGATGTLTLKDITKEFLNGETITGTQSGSAITNGVLAHQAAALFGSMTSIQSASKSDSAWDVAFVVSGGEMRLNVTGAASKTIEWGVMVSIQAS